MRGTASRGVLRQQGLVGGHHALGRAPALDDRLVRLDRDDRVPVVRAPVEVAQVRVRHPGRRLQRERGGQGGRPVLSVEALGVGEGGTPAPTDGREVELLGDHVLTARTSRRRADHLHPDRAQGPATGQGLVRRQLRVLDQVVAEEPVAVPGEHHVVEDALLAQPRQQPRALGRLPAPRRGVQLPLGRVGVHPEGLGEGGGRRQVERPQLTQVDLVDHDPERGPVT